MISADGFGGTRPAGNDPIGQFYIIAPRPPLCKE